MEKIKLKGLNNRTIILTIDPTMDDRHKQYEMDPKSKALIEANKNGIPPCSIK